LVLRFPTGNTICNECVLFANHDIHGDADDTIRCFRCENTMKFVVEFNNDTEVTYEAGAKDIYDRRIYRVVQIDGSFTQLSKFKCIRCAKCETRIPEWEVEGSRYVRLSYFAKDR